MAASSLSGSPAGSGAHIVGTPGEISMLNDLRYALGGLRRDLAFAAVAVLTLALGIGGNLAVFSLLRAVYFDPLPFAEGRGSSGAAKLPVSGHEFVAWKEQARVFEQLALFRREGLNLTGRGEP